MKPKSERNPKSRCKKLEGPSGRFWKLSIESGQTAYIANNVWLNVVLQNHGPGLIGVSIRPDGALIKLLPGGLRAMPVLGALSVASMENKPAVVDIEFMPRFK